MAALMAASLLPKKAKPAQNHKVATLAEQPAALHLYHSCRFEA